MQDDLSGKEDGENEFGMTRRGGEVTIHIKWRHIRK